jgi:hypothetical protein
METETVKLKDQKIRVVFTNENESNELPLEMVFTSNVEDGKRVTQISIDNKLTTTEASFMGSVYMDTLNVLIKIKELLDKKEFYEGLYVLSREEYKQYVTKVLGVKIED